MLTDEHLTTGWEREVDVGDTMLRRFVFHLAAMNAAFTLAGGGRTLETDEVRLADLGRPGGYFNGAVLMCPPADWDASVAAIERFAAGGRGQFFLWSAWPTPDLRPRGWRLSGHPPVLLRSPVALVPVAASGAPEADVRRVRAPAELAAWERTAIASYPLTGLADAPVGSFVTPALLEDDRLHFFVGWDGPRPVTSAVSFVSHGIASLAFGTTAPSARGRGLWRQAAIARLEANPELWFAGIFSDDSRPGAERLGFVPLLRLTLWILDRP